MPSAFTFSSLLGEHGTASAAGFGFSVMRAVSGGVTNIGDLT
jgi:hypothetical protein